MTINTREKKTLRQIAHHLATVIIVGDQGVTEGVLTETDRALKDHELIKIKVHSNDREAKKALVHSICKSRGAELVQLIGHVALIYKPAKNPNPKLSNILRYKQ